MWPKVCLSKSVVGVAGGGCGCSISAINEYLC